MADRVTFDFETGEIIFDTDCQKGNEIDPDLKNKKSAIMAAAGYEDIDMKDLRKEVNALFNVLGFGNVVCAGSDDEDIARAEMFDEMMQSIIEDDTEDDKSNE